MMTFPAHTWNRLADDLSGRILSAGQNVRLAHAAHGVMVRCDSRAGWWEHPWRVSAWHDEKKGWLAVVRAGFVNGEDPTIAGVPLLDMERGEGLALSVAPLEGRPPAFFEAMGVREAGEGVEVDTQAMTIKIVDMSWQDDFRPAERKLWAADIQLSVARLGLVGDVEIVPGDGLAGNVVIYSPGFSAMLLSARSARAALQSVARFEAHRPPSLMERMLGQWDDPQEDILHVARVWLVSPPDYDGAMPDGSCVAYAQHFVFWNLAHASRMAEIPPVLKPITLVTGLAAGVGDRINAAILAPMNDEAQRINTALNTVSPEGKFWTA